MVNFRQNHIIQLLKAYTLKSIEVIVQRSITQSIQKFVIDDWDGAGNVLDWMTLGK